MDKLGLYMDQDLKTTISIVNFGRLEVGSKNEKILYLNNGSEQWPINNIKLDMELDQDLKIEHPVFLAPNETKSVLIYWNPKIERRTPLEQNIIFSGDLIIG